MENRVYYGEYSLSHWISLMLSKNIDLPEYQRHFVWQKRDIIRLIRSMKENQFVQPVTIALYDVGDEKKNLILDGQQRLTSILLAYLGYIPDRKKFADGSREYYASEDDSSHSENEDNIVEDQNETMSILWKFTELTKIGKNKYELIEAIQKDGRYYKIEDNLLNDLDDAFFDNTYLGFSYVIPDSTDKIEVQKEFSNLFRNINYFGKRLNTLESRKSLYYQNLELTKYFEGKCEDGTEALCGLKILEDFQPKEIDFLRYLSILSQYFISNRNDAKKILVGYSAYSSREGFYADYVSYILNLEQENRVNKFNGFSFESVFPNNEWKTRYNVLKTSIARIKPIMQLKDRTSFSAGYEADYWLLGLIYHIVFMGKVLNEDLTYQHPNGKTVTLKEEIDKSITENKSTGDFTKVSNQLGHLRNRIATSCRIYSHYVQ